MKSRPEIIGEKVELLGLFNTVSPEEMESVRVRALKHFEAEGHAAEEGADFPAVRPVRRSQWIAVAAIAAAVTLAVLVAPRMFRPTAGVLEVAGRSIRFGDAVRSNIFGEVVVLMDGSRVEMRTDSELALEQAPDGLRIHLNKGGIIVNAAKQHGHLYVETKDVAVSVIGTVFLVNAEAEGSRVAVIEGEIHVRQGGLEKRLLPGEQVTSNPKMESLSVPEELTWSRQAVAHVAMLQRGTASPATPAPKGSRAAFEVASIRPSGPASPAAPRARGGADAGPIRGCVPGSSGYSQQLDPRRLAITKATLFQLIGYAYPVPGVPDTIWKQYPGADSCLLLSKLGLLPGGPEWIRTELWDIQALIPEGSFSSRPMLTDPKLQEMLQTLLEERFKVAVRREIRETPVYLLKVGRNGAKFNGPRETPPATPLQPEQKPRAIISVGPDGTRTRTVQSPDGTFAGGPAGNVMTGMQVASASRPNDGTIAGGPPSRDGISKLDAARISIAKWINHLVANLDGRPVLDRTGLAGRYDFHFDFRGPSIADVSANPSQFDGLNESVNREAVKAMGFELEESRAPVEVWVIERAEKPSPF